MAIALRRKVGCDACGSSDAAVDYERDDGTKFRLCHKCQHVVNLGNEEAEPATAEVVTLKPKKEPKLVPAVGWRGVSPETNDFYGVKDSGPNEVYYPYHFDGGIAYKVRKKNEKEFWSVGEIKKSGLFGQHLFPAGGKAVTITEGERDAQSGFQMFGSKYPFVSLKNGAGDALKECQASYEWLDSFETIYICFDADEPGQKAAHEVAELFGAKAKIMRHIPGMKDANDYLQAGKVKEFIERWWASEQYQPDGILCTGDLWEEVADPLEKAPVQYPYSKVNDLTYGIRPGELVTVTAGSGLGKSQFLRELVWHIHQKTEDNIGMLFLEEGKRKTTEGLMSLVANKPLHLPQEFANDDEREAARKERREAFDQVHASRRMYLYDWFGSDKIEHIINKLRHMVKGLGCRYIFLDHVTMLVSSQEYGDERKLIDEIMTKLRMFVAETGCALFVVSHLKRPEGRGHEEGAATSLAQLRGSGAIGQLSDIVIGLERNGQAEDIRERNTTKIRVLKNRFAGLTGPAGSAYYDRSTGRMLELIDEEL